MLFLLLTLAGLLLGGFGTLIGAGGGFLLVPALALWLPLEDTERLSALSLAVVFCNALSGTIAYSRRGLVHARSALIYAAAGIPGAIAGTFVAPLLPRTTFDLVLGCFLLAMAIVLTWRTLHKPHTEVHNWQGPTPRQLLIGALVSTFVGFLASLLGIGGGIIHVPLLAYVLAYPVHRATATSHAVLAITVGIASAINIYDGRLAGQWHLAIPLAVGVVIGAQIGAALAKRVHAKWIILALCGAILLVSGRLIAKSVLSKSKTPTRTPATAPANTTTVPP